MALNSQVIVLFKSPRDVQQIRVLARQTGIAYLEAIKDPYVTLRSIYNHTQRTQSDYKQTFSIGIEEYSKN